MKAFSHFDCGERSLRRAENLPVAGAMVIDAVRKTPIPVSGLPRQCSGLGRKTCETSEELAARTKTRLKKNLK
jgi:hypothetical protein